MAVTDTPTVYYDGPITEKKRLMRIADYMLDLVKGPLAGNLTNGVWRQDLLDGTTIEVKSIRNLGETDIVRIKVPQGDVFEEAAGQKRGTVVEQEESSIEIPVPIIELGTKTGWRAFTPVRLQLSVFFKRNNETVEIESPSDPFFLVNPTLEARELELLTDDEAYNGPWTDWERDIDDTLYGWDPSPDHITLPDFKPGIYGPNIAWTYWYPDGEDVVHGGSWRGDTLYSPDLTVPFNLNGEMIYDNNCGPPDDYDHPGMAYTVQYQGGYHVYTCPGFWVGCFIDHYISDTVLLDRVEEWSPSDGRLSAGRSRQKTQDTWLEAPNGEHLLDTHYTYVTSEDSLVNLRSGDSESILLRSDLGTNVYEDELGVAALDDPDTWMVIYEHHTYDYQHSFVCRPFVGWGGEVEWPEENYVFPHYVMVNSPVDGRHTFLVDRADWNYSGAVLCQRIYNFHNHPVYVYGFYNYEEKTYLYGMIWRGKHWQSEKFPAVSGDDIDGHDFYGSQRKWGLVGYGGIRVAGYKKFSSKTTEREATS